MSALANIPALPDDPSDLGLSPVFYMELVLKVAPVKDICLAHGISKERWKGLCADPAFKQQILYYVEASRAEGASFKWKARLQAEELLKTSWAMIHAADTPAVVKADLWKHTIKFAGLDGSQDQKNQAALNNANTFNIQINLGDT